MVHFTDIVFFEVEEAKGNTCVLERRRAVQLPQLPHSPSQGRGKRVSVATVFNRPPYLGKIWRREINATAACK